MSKTFQSLRLFFFLSIILSLTSVPAAFANPPQQESGENLQIVTQDQTGFYTFVSLKGQEAAETLPGVTALQGGAQPTAATALADISVYAQNFGLQNPSQELQLTQTVTADSGGTTFRYQQVYQGIPVIAGEMLAKYTAMGRLTALAGETSPQPNVSVTPTLTADEAIQVALEHVARDTGVTAAELTAAPPALWIYDARLLQPSNLPARLVWRTEVTPAQGHLPIRYLVLVDAHLYTVALAFNQVDTFWGEQLAAYAAARPEAKIGSSTIENTAHLPALAPNFAYPAGETYDSEYTSIKRLTLVCDTPNTALTGAGTCDGTVGATSANMAHHFAYDTFNYYDSHHGRNSIDNAGMALISNVNYRANPSKAYANAFWDGDEMTYGDADYFAVDDVAAHELSHGVTEFSSGLFYFYESGAINESLSDVFGEFVDQANGINSFGGADLTSEKWVLGEDMTAPPIRNMSNPPAYGDPDSTQSPNYQRLPVTNDYWDQGGVHTNSGVSNKAAYLMAAGGTFGGHTVTALGNNKTSAIYYEANTSLLTSGADYEMLGAALVQACYNIMAGTNPLGITTADCIEVDDAVHAVGMHLDPVANVEWSPKASLCPTAGEVPVYLFNDDLESGIGNYTSTKVVGGGSMPASYAWMESSSMPINTPWTTYATSGTKSLFGANHSKIYGYGAGVPYESALTMNSQILLPSDGSSYYFHFNHAVALEPSTNGQNYDGGVLEYSLNGGAWQDASSLYQAGLNYGGTIYTGFGNPLSGRKAFVQDSHGYASTRFNLTALVGNQVRFRWLIGADDIGDYYGWFLDDIQIYRCVTPHLFAQSSGSLPFTSGATYDLGIVFPGTPSTRTIMLTNDGEVSVTLKNSAPTVGSGFSAGNYSATTLNPGDSATFDLTCLGTVLGNPLTSTVAILAEGVDGNLFNFTATCTVTDGPAPTRNYYTIPTVTLAWNPIPGATAYEVQLSTTSTFASLIPVPVTPTDSLTTTTPTLTDATYYWRVRGQRSNGSWTNWSAPDSFIIDLP